MTIENYMICVICEKALTPKQDDIYIVREGELAHRACWVERRDEAFYKTLWRKFVAWLR